MRMDWRRGYSVKDSSVTSLSFPQCGGHERVWIVVAIVSSRKD